MLIYIALPIIGGTERVAQNLQVALAARGVPSRVVTPLASVDAQQRARVIEWHRSSGVAVTDAPALGRLEHVGAWLQFYSWLKRQPEKCVNFQLSSFDEASIAAVAVCRILRRKVILTVHHPVVAASNWRHQAGRVVVAALSNVIVVSTPHLRARVHEILGGHWSDKIVTVALGIPTEQPRDKKLARARLGVDETTMLIATYARLVAGKGLELAICASSKLAESADVKHVIIGDGPLRATLEAGSAAHVRFAGYVEDPSWVLAAADVHLLPSEMEGFGLVYIEAAMQGVPSIGARVGGVPFVIEDDVTGYLVPSGDLDELMVVLRESYSDRRALERMGDAAQLRARSRFTAAVMADAYVEIIAGLAPRWGKRLTSAAMARSSSILRGLAEMARVTAKRR